MSDAAARRTRETAPSAVRRLLVRPIRRGLAPLPSPPSGRLAAEAGPDAEDDGYDVETADVARLTAELALLKAVVRAQRDEVEDLRVEIARAAETGEGRAVRDRWASLVDTLLHTPR